MSDLAHKLEQGAVGGDGNARASLTQLMKRWKAAGVDGGDINPKKPPELVIVTGTRRETWKRLNSENLYELIEATP